MRPTALIDGGDMHLPNGAKLKSVFPGIFAWAEFEPEKGVYRFEWMKEIMGRCLSRLVETAAKNPLIEKKRGILGASLPPAPIFSRSSGLFSGSDLWFNYPTHTPSMLVAFA